MNKYKNNIDFYELLNETFLHNFYDQDFLWVTLEYISYSNKFPQ